MRTKASTLPNRYEYYNKLALPHKNYRLIERNFFFIQNFSLLNSLNIVLLSLTFVNVSLLGSNGKTMYVLTARVDYVTQINIKARHIVFFSFLYFFVQETKWYFDNRSKNSHHFNHLFNALLLLLLIYMRRVQ